MGVLYCIVRGKSRLGALVRRKTCTSLALMNVESDNSGTFTKVVEAISTNFNERYEDLGKHWGSGALGNKSNARIAKLDNAKARQLTQKQG